jgi:hypothetical protein
MEDNQCYRQAPMDNNDQTLELSDGSSFRSALIVAIAADALQLIVIPWFVEGALSPADDILDLGAAALLIKFLGWHWEFLPSFLGKLVPGVDLVPFWTMAVINVYRKSKRAAVEAVESQEQPPALKDPTVIEGEYRRVV